MVTPNKIDVIDKLLQKAKKNDLSFGGISVMFVGDLLQLPPIVSHKDTSEYFTHRYDSKYFYSADIFKDVNIIPIELSKVFRQKDQEFVNILNKIRINKDHRDSLAFVNNKCFLDKQNEEIKTISLVTTNAIAKSINESKLNQVPEKLYTFDAIFSGEMQYAKNLKFPAPDKLNIKIGAEVIFVKNNKPTWINGTLGTVVGIKKDNETNQEYIQVKIKGTENIVSVSRMSWDKIKYKYNKQTKKLEKEIWSGNLN